MFISEIRGWVGWGISGAGGAFGDGGWGDGFTPSGLAPPPGWGTIKLGTTSKQQASLNLGGPAGRPWLARTQKIPEILKKNLFCSKLLGKSICQVPVARGDFLSGKVFPEGLPKESGAIIIWPLF